MTFGQSFARSRDSRFFPSKPGISSILPTQPSFGPEKDEPNQHVASQFPSQRKTGIRAGPTGDEMRLTGNYRN
jgi:hypothetical protein